MPFPIAHALVGAGVVAALLPHTQPNRRKSLLLGALLGVCPDFDYFLNWMRVSGGGWHHGFTHSFLFAIAIGVLLCIALKEWRLKSVLLYGAATGSHTLLDFVLTESRGVALFWPLTNYRYKLRIPNPIDYTWGNGAAWETAMDIFRICFTELIIFGALFMVVLAIRLKASRFVTENRG